MIIQKKKDKPVIQEEEFVVEDDGVIKAYYAIKDIISKVVWDRGPLKGQPILKTIKINQGQYNRIVRKMGNREFAVAFPAAFVEFVDMSYRVSQQRMSEGHGTMKIKFILNKLNNEDLDTFDENGQVIEYNESQPLHVAQLLTNAIEENYRNYEALTTRCNLQYIDPMETMDDGLQPVWLTYEIWFRQETYMSKRYLKEVNLTFSPFVGHADQSPENNPENHTNADHIEQFKDHEQIITEGTGEQ